MNRRNTTRAFILHNMHDAVGTIHPTIRIFLPDAAYTGLVSRVFSPLLHHITYMMCASR